MGGRSAPSFGRSRRVSCKRWCFSYVLKEELELKKECILGMGDGSAEVCWKMGIWNVLCEARRGQEPGVMSSETEKIGWGQVV